MLAPQYSLRRLLALVTVCAFGCLIFAAAISGQLWAVAVSLAMGGVVVLLLVYGLTFAVVRGIGIALDRRRGRLERTPA